MTCAHCGGPLPAGCRRDRLYCQKNCRQVAYLARRRTGASPQPRWHHPSLESTNPVLRAAAARAEGLGEARGWSPSTIRCAMDGLTVLLEGRPAGTPVKVTEIRARTPRHASNLRVAEVLTDLDLLDDDSTLAVRAWVDRRTSELPRGFADDVRAWLLVLLDGDISLTPVCIGQL